MTNASKSLVRRVERFFRNNPDEFLTLDDMAVKFEASRESCQWAVRDLKKEGSIESAHVYRAKPMQAPEGGAA